MSTDTFSRKKELVYRLIQCGSIDMDEALLLLGLEKSNYWIAVDPYYTSGTVSLPYTYTTSTTTTTGTRTIYDGS